MVEVEEIDIDRYGRVVGLVSVGNLVLNRHLVAYGYAWVYHRYCKRPFCSEWSKVEAKARKAKRGLWKTLMPSHHGNIGAQGRKNHTIPGKVNLLGRAQDVTARGTVTTALISRRRGRHRNAMSTVNG